MQHADIAKNDSLSRVGIEPATLLGTKHMFHQYLKHNPLSQVSAFGGFSVRKGNFTWTVHVDEGRGSVWAKGSRSAPVHGLIKHHLSCSISSGNGEKCLLRCRSFYPLQSRTQTRLLFSHFQADPRRLPSLPGNYRHRWRLLATHVFRGFVTSETVSGGAGPAPVPHRSPG